MPSAGYEPKISAGEQSQTHALNRVATEIGMFIFNPLNAELNPICHLLALLGAHHILYASRIRVKKVKCTLVQALYWISFHLAS